MKQQQVVSDLAERVAAIAHSEANARRRELWTRHNRLEKVRPPVYVRTVFVGEMFPEKDIVIKSGPLREVEIELRRLLFDVELGFDQVVDPFFTVPAVYGGPAPEEIWGVTVSHRQPQEPGGAWRYEPPLRDPADIEKLRKPPYVIDEAKTAARVAVISEALGDVLPIRIENGGVIGISASIGNTAAELRGLEPLMMDVLDRPEWVHRLMCFLMEAHLDYMREMERQNRVTPNHVRWPFYHPPLCPDYDPGHVRLKDCWGYAESQEFDLFSPAMLDEFLLPYQIPILALSTLNHYGCCENLTQKYSLLAKIPGLRRVSVSPWTDFAAAVETTAGKYALNWRYSPTEVVFNFDPQQVRRTIRECLTLARYVPVEIILQDVQTVNDHPEHIREWVHIAMEEAERSVR